MNLAQSQNKNELSVYLGGGITSFNDKTNNAIDTKKQFGGMIGIGYSYNITPSFALATGLEYSLYANKMNVNEINETYITQDDDGAGVPIEYSLLAKDVEEKQKVGYLQIPFMLKYTYPVSNSMGLYFGGGAKIAFAVYENYNQNINNITTSAYYKDQDHLIDDFPENGMGNLGPSRSDGDLKFKTAYFASAELGLNIGLSKQIYLSTGLYIDYGLNNVNDNKTKETFSEYRFEDEHPYPATYSLIQSSYRDESFVEKIKPLSVGIKLKLNFLL